MTRTRARVLAALLAPCGAGCGHDERLRAPLGPPGELVIEQAAAGRITLRDAAGPVAVAGGWAEALVEVAGDERSFSTRSCSGAWEPLGAPAGAAAWFGALEGARFGCEADGIALDWQVRQDPLHHAAILLLALENRRPDEIRVLRLSPLVAEGPDAGLFVGMDPARHRILDDGQNLAADTEANVHFPDEPRNALIDVLVPIEGRGDVVANWNHAVVDLDSGRSWIAGALGVERTFPTLGTRFVADEAPRSPWDGRPGFGGLWADMQLAFRGKPLAPAERVESEPLWADPLAPDPFTGLESYADAVAAWTGVSSWTARGGAVPNGWNSWTGSEGTGGLGTNIDESVMRENLAVMAREFAPFGVDWFQIDDGYQVADGDWDARPDRFPSGMAAFAEEIRDAGLLPGIWISAFRVAEASRLASEHPDWLSDPKTSILGPFLSPGEGARMLDLSSDGAIEWLAQTLARYRNDWGMRWLKLDFAYLALPHPPAADPRLTSVEAYKRGLRAVREGIGDDAFYLGIGLVGLNFGIVDGMRVTLDDGPRWDQDDPFSLLGSGGSFKSSVKTGARRYYLHGRVWLTHDDLLFFRTDPGRPEPPVSFDEAVALASFFGLSGSIVKFGEDLRTLEPEQIQVWRKLLPIYPAGARPLDLFRRHYPELWHLPIRGTLRGSGAEWEVVGLLNWGLNYALDGEAIEPLPDADRDYAIDLAELGLDPAARYLASEFWGERLLGEVTGRLEQRVRAHTGAVIALRRSTGRPQFLGHNRHLTQGATDLLRETWLEAERALELEFQLDAGSPEAVPFEYRFRVHVPEGWALRDAHAPGASVDDQGSLLVVRMLPEAPGVWQMRLEFE